MHQKRNNSLQLEDYLVDAAMHACAKESFCIIYATLFCSLQVAAIKYNVFDAALKLIKCITFRLLQAFNNGTTLDSQTNSRSWPDHFQLYKRQKFPFTNRVKQKGVRKKMKKVFWWKSQMTFSLQLKSAQWECSGITFIAIMASLLIFFFSAFSNSFVKLKICTETKTRSLLRVIMTLGQPNIWLWVQWDKFTMFYSLFT